MDSLITITTEYYSLLQHLLLAKAIVDHKSLGLFRASLTNDEDHKLRLTTQSEFKYSKIEFEFVMADDKPFLKHEGKLYRIYWSREECKVTLKGINMIGSNGYWMIYYGPK